MEESEIVGMRGQEHGRDFLFFGDVYFVSYIYHGLLDTARLVLMCFARFWRRSGSLGRLDHKERPLYTGKRSG